MFNVKQKFGVLDKFGDQYQIAEVEYGNLPAWVDRLIVQCTSTDIRYALDRYAEPLVVKILLTPTQCLDRIPKPARHCQIWESCHGWKPACMNLKENDCELLELPGASPEEAHELTALVNLWRDGYNVVRAVE